MQRRIVGATALAAAVIVLAAGCSSSKSPSSSSSAPAGQASSPSAAPAVSGTVTVLAAASLKEAFTTLGKQFETAHPGTKVKLSFGASSDLAEQINQGAPADVFASASPKNVEQVVSASGASKSTNFAKNVMEVAVPPSNPGHVTSVTDLAKSSVKSRCANLRCPAVRSPPRCSRTPTSPSSRSP